MATPSGFTPHDPSESEEGRAFYQERIALFNFVMFTLSGGFFVAGGIAARLTPGFDWALHIKLANGMHALAATVPGLIWLWARRGQRSAHALVRGADVAGTTLQILAYSGMCVLAPTDRASRMDLIALLTLFAVLTARAVIVPSAARQTLMVGLLCSVPVLYAAQRVGIAYEGIIPSARAYTFINGILWCVVGIVISTVASRVIYGLRSRVQRAERLGQYLLDEKIGEGGMGVVYRAHHALLRRPTAVKLLPAERAGAQALARFEREVTLTSRLTHPNTVAIFDYGRTPDGVFYYAMEYLDGFDLERLMELDGPQPPGRVAHILKQVCGALAEAHGLGLVHRDIKPANIILCERGGVPDIAKVVDFGLVKELEVSGDGAAVQATTATTILGTPLYLSPEGITDHAAVSAASDLYALGAVGYFLLTGAPPFQGRTVVEVCGMHLHTQPEPPSARLGRPVPAALEQALLRCLEKSPSKRPASARALKELLEATALPWTEAEAATAWQRTRSELTRPSGERPRTTHATTVLAVDLEDRADGEPIAS